MNRDDLEKELKEILSVIKVCPKDLQEKCFEILLQNALSKTVPAEAQTTTTRAPISTTAVSVQPEIEKRVKTFAGNHKLSNTDITAVFGFDDTAGVTIEVTDLKAKKISQQQRRLALLIGVRHQFAEGNFDVPKDELRESCVTYSAYDAANFVQNLKNMKEIFAGFKPSSTTFRLSPKGKSHAAELIKELAS